MSQPKILVIGLTGSIGMGKSTVARQLARHGAAVFDADEAVHVLLAKDKEIFEKIKKNFPMALWGGRISRKRLGACVFAAPEKRKKLESLLHPRVRQAQRVFIAQAIRAGKKAVVLEIPLLFETGGDKECHVTVCVSAPKERQQERVMRRKNMSRKKLAAIVARQFSDAEKRKRADVVIWNGGSRRATNKQVAALWKGLTAYA